MSTVGSRRQTIRRDLMPAEAPHLPQTLDDVAAVGDQLRELGYGAPAVAGLESWLIRKALGRPDRTAATTRSRYRKMLAELGTLPPAAPTRRRRSEEGASRAVACAVASVSIAVASVLAIPPAKASQAAPKPPRMFGAVKQAEGEEDDEEGDQGHRLIRGEFGRRRGVPGACRAA